MSVSFRALSVPDPSALMFGRAPKPVSCGFGLELGKGQVYLFSETSYDL